MPITKFDVELVSKKEIAEELKITEKNVCRKMNDWGLKGIVIERNTYWPKHLLTQRLLGERQ